MSLRLPSDKDLSLQSHLDELSIRLGRLLAIFVFMMVLSWNFIDQILNNYFSLLSPCIDCMSVYSPTEWVSLRWLSIFLISLCFSLPFFFREVIVFSNPGLMSHERKWLKQLFFFGTITIGIAISFTLIFLLPFWFSVAEELGFVEGVVPRYSASAMLEFALVICYVEMILFLSSISAILLRRSGIAEDEQKFPWQLRLHGASIFFMWLVIPLEYDTLLFIGILFELILVEFCFSNFNAGSNSLPKLKPGQGILDSEARLRRIAIVGCTCCGIVELPQKKSIPSGMVYFCLPDFCVDKKSQDFIIESAIQIRLTDVIITGCYNSSINSKLIESLECLDCSIRTLSLIDFHSIRTTDSNKIDIDFQIRMAIERDPWTPEKSYDRVRNLLNQLNEDEMPDVAYWTDLDKPPFGTDLLNNEIILTSLEEPSNETILEFELIGVKLSKLPDYLYSG